VSAMVAEEHDVEAAVDDMAARATSVIADTGGSGFRERWRALASLGVLGGRKAEQGVLAPVIGAVAAVEGIGRAGVPAGLCYAMASQRFGLQFPLQGLLSAEARRSLDAVAEGDLLLCHALTEESGGSDPLSMCTRADRDVDGYVLTGRKAFVTAAPVADLALVFARTSPEAHPFALSAFLVDLHAPGVTRSDPFPKIALVDAPMGALDFDEVRLPPDSLVGGEGSGLAVLATTTTWERGLLLSYALGPMRRVLDHIIAWANSREHFGRRMGASPLVAGRVSDMGMGLFRSRRLVYAMAGRLEPGAPAQRFAAEAALTKISIAEDYQAFARHAAALGGVRSFVADTGLTTNLADPVAATTYAGPDDLLRLSVARLLGLPVQN
jgi:alkylation response protein AidB-like acyl-CoA dehydrogenase